MSLRSYRNRLPTNGVPTPQKPATGRLIRSRGRTFPNLILPSEHHPELARLLEQLRKSRPHEFQRAVRELIQQIQTLEKLQERNSTRYAHQLELWKNDSQIRVLVAKWSHTQNDALEQEIRGLLQQRRDMKLAQLKFDQQRLTEQLQKVEKQIATVSDSELEREWEQLAKKTNSSRKAGNKNSSN